MVKDKDSLVTENVNLVHALCKRYVGKGIDYDDLYGAGCIGLVAAANRYDETLGYAFSTFAVPSILGEIRRLFRDGGAVKVSRMLKEQSIRAEKEREILAKALGREPKISELAEKLGLSVTDTAEALSVSASPLSLSNFDDSDKDFDLPVDSGEEGIVNKISLETAVNSLSKDDKELITLRYFGYKTQSETAEILNMTQVQVSRKEKKILCILREKLA